MGLLIGKTEDISQHRCYLQIECIYENAIERPGHTVRNSIHNIDDVIVTLKGSEPHFREQLLIKNIECIIIGLTW